MQGKKNPGQRRCGSHGRNCEKVRRNHCVDDKASLKEVINATGIVIHTNLGRAPLGRKVLEDIASVALGYSNLEYDLQTMQRGRRADHVVPLITYLAKAEDAVIVNNNAAGIMVALNTLARGKEVIISERAD